MDLNYAAILVATVVAFVMSSAWYGVLGSKLARLNDAYADTGSIPAWKVLVELVRSLVVAAVLAGSPKRLKSRRLDPRRHARPGCLDRVPVNYPDRIRRPRERPLEAGRHPRR
jgi:hypothetical protein